MVDTELLREAVVALELVSRGLLPDRIQALAGGFGLDGLKYEGSAARALTGVDLLAAAVEGLFRIGCGGSWQLTTADRSRIAELAAAIWDWIVGTETGALVTLH